MAAEAAAAAAVWLIGARCFWNKTRLRRGWRGETGSNWSVVRQRRKLFYAAVEPSSTCS